MLDGNVVVACQLAVALHIHPLVVAEPYSCCMPFVAADPFAEAGNLVPSVRVAVAWRFVAAEVEDAVVVKYLLGIRPCSGHRRHFRHFPQAREHLNKPN